MATMPSPHPSPQGFRVLQSSKDLDDVLMQAGEASRRASEYLDDDEAPQTPAPLSTGNTRHLRKKVTSVLQSSRSMAQATLRFPKTPRDAPYAALFWAHVVVAWTVPLWVSGKGWRSWLSGRAGALAVAAGFLGAFIAAALLFDPRRGRKHVFNFAGVFALVSVASLLAVALVAWMSSDEHHHWKVIGGAFGFVVVLCVTLRALVSALRSLSQADLRAALRRGPGTTSRRGGRDQSAGNNASLLLLLFLSCCCFCGGGRLDDEHPEAFFDAVAGVAVRFFQRRRSATARLVFGALSLQTAFAISWTSAHAFVREESCRRNGAAVVAELTLVFHLFFVSQVLRYYVRGVVSGLAVHDFLKLQRDLGLFRPAWNRQRDDRLDVGTTQKAPSPPTGRHQQQKPLDRRTSSGDASDTDSLLGSHFQDVDELLLSNSTPEYVESRSSRAESPPSRKRKPPPRRARRPVRGESPESHFPRLFVTWSFGSVCKAALLVPSAELLSYVRRSPYFETVKRPIAFAHVAAFNKAYVAAARDVGNVLDESGVSSLRESDCVVPVLATYRVSLATLLAVLGTSVTLIHRHARIDTAVLCQDTNALLLYFLVAFFSVALAIEPLIAAVDVAYLAYAQIPGGLQRADEILFHALSRRLRVVSGDDLLGGDDFDDDFLLEMVGGGGGEADDDDPVASRRRLGPERDTNFHDDDVHHDHDDDDDDDTTRIAAALQTEARSKRDNNNSKSPTPEDDAVEDSLLDAAAAAAEEVSL